MEWKVRALDDEGNPIEPKQENVQEEVTQEQVAEPVQNEEVTEEEVMKELDSKEIEEQVEEVQEVEKPTELDDNAILNYFKERHNKEFESVDVLLNNETNAISEDVPEYLQKLRSYVEETGRGIEDYVAMNKDWDSVEDSTAMREYYKSKKPLLSTEEIDYLISQKYSYDADIDDENEIKNKQIAYKEELYEAKSYLNNLKEKYKAPLESSGERGIPENYLNAFKFYNEYAEQSEKDKQVAEERSKIFQEKTNSLFSEEFKGFEFNIGDKKLVYKPSDLDKVKSTQMNVANFYQRHLGEDGTVKDIQSYHKDFYAAMNVDAIVKSAYEQGKADATEGLVKETKNLDMDVRKNVQSEQNGTQFRVLSSNDDFQFKVRKRS